MGLAAPRCEHEDCALSGSLACRRGGEPGVRELIFALVGKDEAMPSLMRRTETRTNAPIEGWIKRRERWLLPDPPKLSWSL